MKKYVIGNIKMNFLKKIKNSIYNPQYYNDLIDQPFAYSAKYFFFFSLIFILLLTLEFSFSVIPGLYVVIKDAGQSIIKNYPEELTVTVKNGNVSTNVQEPYFIKITDSWQNRDEEKNYKNIIAIDTQSEPIVSNFKKYNSFVLITKNFVIYQEDSGEIVSHSLENIPDVIINKDIISNFVGKYFPYLNLLLPLCFIIMLIISLFVIIFRLFYLFIAALFIWLIAHIKNTKISYGKSYQLGLHLMTLPLLLDFLMGLFIPINFPFLFTIILLVVAVINIKNKNQIVSNNNSITK